MRLIRNSTKHAEPPPPPKDKKINICPHFRTRTQVTPLGWFLRAMKGFRVNAACMITPIARVWINRVRLPMRVVRENEYSPVRVHVGGRFLFSPSWTVHGIFRHVGCGPTRAICFVGTPWRMPLVICFFLRLLALGD